MRTDLRVLSKAQAERLRAFNGAARLLQRMGVRLQRIEPQENRLTVVPEDGRRLLKTRLTEGFQRIASAGSTLYRVQFQGVAIEWREPISYARPEDWAALTTPTVH